MKRYATILLGLLMAGVTCLAQAQDAQDVTVRELNSIPAENIDELKAQGTSLTSGTISSLIYNNLVNDRVKVRFTAVVLSNPRNSGLASANAEGFPGRIHIFVRDTSAATQGNDGMGIQVVDGSYSTTGSLSLAVGDVVTIVGTASPFNQTMQFAPESIELEGPYQSFGLPDSILDPVIISTSDANSPLEEDGKVQVNWDNLAALRGQWVRVEGATVLARDISTTRPDWIVSSDGGESVLNFYDTSLRYRNDRRTAYNASEFNVRTNNFTPPPPGARINLQGYLSYVGDDPFNRGVPQGALLSIIPMADEDLVITETPPQAARPTKPQSIPAPATPVTVTADVRADLARTLTDVNLAFTTSDSATPVVIPMTKVEGDTYSAEIPGQADGVFVIYSVTATDNTGATSVSPTQDYRVLEGGINSIADIQEHSGESGGASPFVGMTTAMDITATVQTPPAFSSCSNCVLGFSVQDDDDLAAWSGIFISDAEALTANLSVGDVINITNAEVRENFGVTFLRNITYTKESSGSPLPHKVITTDVLKDADIAEAHEGMLLRFEGPIITSTNADAPAGPFGEWGFSSDGTTANQLRADDTSLQIPFGTAGDFSVWERLEYLQGVWWFSFSNWKLVPVTLDDIGEVTNVAVEDEIVPGSFALSQNYPNPFNPVTTIEYAVPASGQVTLEVIDMLGRTVATLVDGEFASGTYQVRFDARDLPSALYLYRLTAGTHTMSRKMLLVK